MVAVVLVCYVSHIYKSRNCSSAYRQSPNCGSPSKTKVGPKGKCLENIGASADAPIDGDGDSPFCNRDDLAEDIERRRDAIKLPSAMVGDDNPIEAMFNSKISVGRSVD